MEVARHHLWVYSITFLFDFIHVFYKKFRQFFLCNVLLDHPSNTMETNIEQNFITVYEENVQPLFRYCLAHISDREIAKDVVQDSFTKTWDYIAKGSEVKNLKAFLYKTLKNLIIDHYRSKKSSSLDALSEEENFDPPAYEEVSAEERLDAKGAFKLLEKLPPEYKDVIILRCVEDMSFKEIGQITGETENTVAVRYHRGLKKVKKLFNNDEQ